MNKIYIFLFFIALITFSCVRTEKNINPVENSMKYFISTDGDNPQLKVIEFPSKNVITEDFLRDITKNNIDNTVENIKEFNGNYYIFVPKSFKIFVVKKSDLSLVTTIDFSDEKFEPIDLVFANSTDCYIVHRNSIYLSLLDLTNFVKAKKITIGNPPHQIAISTNQIFVTNQLDNTISIVDSRDKKEVAKLQTESYPTFIRTSPNGNSFICICTGTGKINNNEEKSPAVIQYYDKETRQLIASQELGFAGISASEQNPQGFVITPREWGFIPTNENFLRIDMKTKDRINLITKRFYYFINYDKINNQLLLLREIDNRTDFLFADESTGDIIDFFSFPYKIKFVAPY